MAFTYNWGCLIGWSSLNSPSDFKSILFLYFALILWTIVYDTVYATQDEEEDKNRIIFKCFIFLVIKKFLLKYNDIFSISSYFLFWLYSWIQYIVFVSVLFSSIVNFYFLIFFGKVKRKLNSYFKLNNLIGVLLLLSFILSDGI